MKQGHQFELTLSRRDGAPLVGDTGQPVGPIPVQVDFEPAREWARFEVLRAGDIDCEQASANSPEPIWDVSQGPPYVHAFSVSVTSNGSSRTIEFPTTYFAETARVLSLYFVQKGQLKAGEIFYYVVTSRPLEPVSGAGRPGPSRLSVRRKTPPLDLRTDKTVEEMMANSQPYGDPIDEDMPVFVAQDVLDEVARQTRDAGSLEAGAFLIGYLHRCPVSLRVFLRITDQIPAEHTRQELVKLTFTAETFDAARQSLKDRGANEILAGWAHSHSWLQDTCKDCTKRDQGKCTAKADFFSEDDVHVHKTAFLKAFSVALVAGNSPYSGLTWALYGWKLGMIQRRGFYITPDNHNEQGEKP